MKDDNIPRCSWKLGKIQKLITGHDGQIRSAEVLLPSGGVIARTICHLYPLELPSKTDEQITMMDNRRSEDDVTENDDINNQEQYSTKHDKKRKAHLIARQRIHKCLRDNPTSVLFALPGGCQD